MDTLWTKLSNISLQFDSLRFWRTLSTRAFLLLEVGSALVTGLIAGADLLAILIAQIVCPAVDALFLKSIHV